MNPLITDIRKKGKNLHDQISDLNGRGFDILNDSGKLPMKFKNKNFADLNIDELAELKSILKSSKLPDIQDINKKLKDIDDFLLDDIDNYGKNLKNEVEFQNNLAEIERFHKPKLLNLKKHFSTNMIKLFHFLKKINILFILKK